MKYSVIIPTYNNLTYLCQVLGCTKRFRDAEIIVVVDYRDQQSKPVAESFGVKCITGGRSFSHACNLGARAAEGEYLLFLNDDTLPLEDCLDRLRDCFSRAPEFLKTDFRVGAAGPVSNCVSGNQYIQAAGDPVQIQKRLPTMYLLTPFLIGFCVMIRKDVFFQLGMFDEELANGAQDLALCVRMLEKGFIPVIDASCFVYHYGNRTLSREEFRSEKMGVAYVPRFHEKYSLCLNPRKNKLIAIYRVKIDHDVHSWFLRSLQVTTRIADKVLVLDDGSPITWNFNHPKVEVRRYDRPFDELRDRQELYDWAVSEGATWVLSLDADEALDDQVTREDFERLMNPMSPFCFGYYFVQYTHFDSEEVWRADGVWGKQDVYRWCRVQPYNTKLFAGGHKGLHCSHLPVLPQDCIFSTGIRMRHFGYLTRKARNEKRMFYDEIDTQKNPLLIGNKDYSHLNDSVRTIVEWNENNSIAVSTICLNEKGNLFDWLSPIWSFAKEIVICDTGSTDGTDEWLRRFGVTVVKKFTKDFSEARNYALDQIKSPWVLQIDFDERISPPVSHSLTHLLRCCENKNVHGYLFDINNLTRQGTAVSNTIRLFRSFLRYHNKVHETVDKDVIQKRCNILKSPVKLIHFGFLGDADTVKEKFKRYYTTLEEELLRDPLNSVYWYTIALHLLEDPKYWNVAVECYKNAIKCMPEFGLPYRDLVRLYLKMAEVTCRSGIKAGMKELKEVEELLIRICGPDPVIVPHLKELFEERGYGPRINLSAANKVVEFQRWRDYVRTD